jgi:large subunit ribosomal protein L29
METDKIRNLTSDELVQQEKDSMDQLFRLKFQMKMGQTESLNKIRGLRKDIARIKTIARQRELEGEPGSAAIPAGEVAVKSAVKPARKAAGKPAKRLEKK